MADPDSTTDDDPLAPVRGDEEALQEIADSDAPDAPVAEIVLALLRDEPIPEEALKTLEREGATRRA